MNVNIISKYRSQLMGIAIVLVALFHSNIVRANNVLDYLCFSGDIGVDIFFFLSGFGMFYAYLKKPTVQEFYWKRLVRIVPVWFLVNLYIQLDNVGFQVQHINLLEFFKQMTGFSFWIDGNLYFWYIPAQLAFYLITPLFMYFYRKDKKNAYAVFGIAWIILLLVSILLHDAKYFIFLFRWPVYFLGIGIGELSYKQRSISKRQITALMFLMLAGFVLVDFIRKNNGHGMIRYDFKYFAYVVIVIPFVFGLSWILSKIKWRKSVLSFLGGITLEIYLLHEFILRKICSVVEKIPFDSCGIIFNILVFIVAVGISWLLHSCVTCVEKWNKEKVK